MKGVVLAGGTGSRLHPLTKITNKHLLPIYDKPMVYYPIQTLVDAGIRDIMIVTGGRNAGDFLRLLGAGKEFGLVHLNYAYQEGEGGIAEALGVAEHFADGQKICVILGDNLIEGSIRHAVEEFRAQPAGARAIPGDRGSAARRDRLAHRRRGATFTGWLVGRTDASGKARIEFPVAQIPLWSPERPALHDVVLSSETDQIAERVGISQMHVSRLIRRSLEKLREEIGELDSPEIMHASSDDDR